MRKKTYVQYLLLMDYLQYIPVLCRTEGNFRGKCYWEKMSSVVSHNGKSVDGSKTKSDLEEGDEVVIRFDGQDYSGVVKYNEKVIATHSQSPPPTVQELESGEATAASNDVARHNKPQSRPQYTPKKRWAATRKNG